jgi:hypothetical protein
MAGRNEWLTASRKVKKREKRPRVYNKMRKLPIYNYLIATDFNKIY